MNTKKENYFLVFFLSLTLKIIFSLCSNITFVFNINKLTINRAAFLGQIMREYKNSIAVSGTHGKTSTTSMLSTIFEYANLDPTILVGGNLSVIGGNVKIGNSDHFITEACEYVDSFLNFNPKISIVFRTFAGKSAKPPKMVLLTTFSEVF